MIDKLKTMVASFKKGLIQYLNTKPNAVSATFTLGLAIGAFDLSLGLFFLGGYALWLLSGRKSK